MSEVLPTELLERIAECLEDNDSTIRDLVSLCSTTRGFVGCCQRRIFRKVTLYHPVSPFRPMIPQEYPKKYSKTISFAQTVAQRPDLALHVKTLRYWLPSDVIQETDGFFPSLIQALISMENVASFQLGFDDRCPVPPYLAMRSRAWQRALASLVQRPALTHLTLINILPFPLEVLLGATQLEALEVYNTSLECLATLPATTLALKKLKFEGPVAMLSPPNEHRASLLGVPELDKLDVHFGVSRDFSGQAFYLIRECQALRTLRIPYVECNQTTPVISPLDQLNPASFAWLTHLTIHTITDVHRISPITHPYRTLPTSSVLPQLKKLETLVLDVFFQGRLIVHPSTFGPYPTWEEFKDILGDRENLPSRLRGVSVPQWTDIYDVVSDRCHLPAVKTFSVNIHLRPLSALGNPKPPNSMSDAFIDHFQALVKPVILNRIKEIQAGGIPIEFKLWIGTSVGPQIGL